GHAGLQRRPSDYQSHLLRGFREVQHGLPRRVASADDDEPSPAEHAHVADRHAVVDARAREPLDSWHAETAVRRSRSDDHAARRNLDTVGESENPAIPARFEFLHLARENEFRAEEPRLLIGTLRELRAADPSRKTEIVA